MKKMNAISVLAVTAGLMVSCSSSEKYVEDVGTSRCGAYSMEFTRSNDDSFHESNMQRYLTLTREDGNLYCEYHNYLMGCSADDVKVESSHEPGKIDVTTQNEYGAVSTNCMCSVTLYFTLRDVHEDEFTLNITGSEPLKFNMRGHEKALGVMHTGEVIYDVDASRMLGVYEYEFVRSDDDLNALYDDQLSGNVGTKMLVMEQVPTDFFPSLTGTLKYFPLPADATSKQVKARIDEDGRLVIEVVTDGKDTERMVPHNIRFSIMNPTGSRYHLRLNRLKATGAEGKDSSHDTVCEYEGDVSFEKGNGYRVEIRL